MKLYELLGTNFLMEQEKIDKVVLYKDKVEVKQYLPLIEKFNFIFEALQKASENNGYVSITKAEIAFRVLILKYYTNIEFVETWFGEEGEDVDQPLSDEEIYDICYVNGLMSDIFKLIPDKEYEDLLDMLMATVNEVNEANKSLVGAIDTINNLMITGIKNMSKAAESLDTEQTDKVIELANSLGFKEMIKKE